MNQLLSTDLASRLEALGIQINARLRRKLYRYQQEPAVLEAAIAFTERKQQVTARRPTRLLRSQLK